LGHGPKYVWDTKPILGTLQASPGIVTICSRI
jgi:hypothetical protein